MRVYKHGSSTSPPLLEGIGFARVTDSDSRRKKAQKKSDSDLCHAHLRLQGRRGVQDSNDGKHGALLEEGVDDLPHERGLGLVDDEVLVFDSVAEGDRPAGPLTL